MTVVFLIHYSLCCFMTGLIWLVQLVHYPSFNFINNQKNLDFHDFHCKNITLIVAPTMITELGSGVLLYYIYTDNLILLVNIALLLAIWVSTFLLQVKIHDRLSEKFDSLLISKLVKTNWIRTIAWTLRAIILSQALLKYLKNGLM